MHLQQGLGLEILRAKTLEAQDIQSEQTIADTKIKLPIRKKRNVKSAQEQSATLIDDLQVAEYSGTNIQNTQPFNVAIANQRPAEVVSYAQVQELVTIAKIRKYKPKIIFKDTNEHVLASVREEIDPVVDVAESLISVKGVVSKIDVVPGAPHNMISREVDEQIEASVYTESYWQNLLGIEPEDKKAEQSSIVDAGEVVLLDIQEHIEITDEAAKQTAILIAILPQEVQKQLAAFVEDADTKAVTETEQLVVKIAVAADRLHELAMNDQIEGEEAEQIQALLVEWYGELLASLDLDVDSEEVAAFISLICSEAYQPMAAEYDEELLDNSLHERKHQRLHFSTIKKTLAYAERAMHREIARLMVSRATA